jgi:hypothetical protein
MMNLTPNYYTIKLGKYKYTIKAQKWLPSNLRCPGRYGSLKTYEVIIAYPLILIVLFSDCPFCAGKVKTD